MGVEGVQGVLFSIMRNWVVVKFMSMMIPRVIKLSIM